MTFWIIVAAVVAVLGGALWAWSRRASRNIARVKDLTDHFFKSADVLVTDDRVPLSIVDQVEFMGGGLRSRALARLIFHMLWTGEMRKVVERARDDEERQFDADVRSLAPELRKQLHLANANFLIAITYQLPVRGWLLRRFSFFFVQPKKRDGDDDFIERIVALGISRHSHA